MNKRLWLTMIVNALSLIFLMGMISTGLLLQFILLHRSGSLALLSFNRHEWAGFHFYISIGFISLLLTHLLLHWRWIQNIAWGTKSAPQSLFRKLITVCIIIITALMLIFPWVAPKEQGAAGLRRMNAISNGNY